MAQFDSLGAALDTLPATVPLPNLNADRFLPGTYNLNANLNLDCNGCLPDFTAPSLDTTAFTNSMNDIYDVGSYRPHLCFLFLTVDGISTDHCY